MRRCLGCAITKRAGSFVPPAAGKPECGSAGTQSLKTFCSIDNPVFREKCAAGECPIYAAFDGDKIVGIMGMRSSKTHINLVFTKKEYHHQGIATALFQYLLTDRLNENPDLREITLNSSPYGKGFYLHLGFVPVDTEQTVNGIRFTPMRYSINSPQKPEQQF